MKKTIARRPCYALFLFLAAILPPSLNCLAYTPKDRSVRRMIDRGMPILESGSDNRTGGMAVIALALVKAGKPSDHPQVVKAVQKIQADIQASGGDPAKLQMDGSAVNDIYSLGTSAIFLSSLDPVAYRREIEFLLESLYTRQKPHGGWGYENRDTGDTSMTQYVVLSLWEANQANIGISPRALEGVASWLLRTQDPSGAYAYQGTVSPSFQPVQQAQHEIRLSMVAAGLGSVYICSDLMGYTKKTAADENEISALEAVNQQDGGTSDGGAPKIRTSIDKSVMRRAQDRGNRWMAANFVIDPKNVSFKHYYLYALERYCSFRELDEGKGGRKDSPRWYDAGVEYLMSTQDEDGGWKSAINKPVDTAFAILFLLRSTQKSIQRKRGFGPGTLVGGRGFPKEGDIVMRNGQAVAKPLLGPFEAMRKAMGNPEKADLAEALGRIDELGPKQSEVLVSEFAEKLRDLAGDPSPENRIAAVKTLGRSGDIGNCPMLILALDDEDAAVVLEARDGLRRLSRKIGGFGLPDDFSPADRNQAIKQWRAWYKEIHPDAEF